MSDERRKSDVLTDISRSVVTYDPVLARGAVTEAMGMGIPAEEIIRDGLGAGMAEVGERFDIGKFYLPQVVAASKVMTDCLAILEPVMTPDTKTSKGCIIMGSVHGDIHEIGKNVCSAMLRGAGYEVIDLGADVSCERFVEAAKKHQASIIGASALMTTTLFSQRELVRYIKEIGEDQKVAVGGAPCTQAWCDEIGAAGYSASGTEIIKLIEHLVWSS